MKLSFHYLLTFKFAFEVILKQKTDAPWCQSTLATVLPHNSTKCPWLPTRSIYFSHCVCRGGGLAHLEGARLGRLPAVAVIHKSFIFLLGSAGRACFSHGDGRGQERKHNQTRPRIASSRNMTVTTASSCWPKQAMRPNPKSEGKEMYSTPFMGRSTNHMWVEGEVKNRGHYYNFYNLPHCLFLFSWDF